MLIVHEVAQPSQIQVFVGGKLFFLLCMQQTATNLSSTLRLLFYASSDHIVVFLPTSTLTDRSQVQILASLKPEGRKLLIKCHSQ